MIKIPREFSTLGHERYALSPALWDKQAARPTVGRMCPWAYPERDHNAFFFAADMKMASQVHHAAISHPFES
jgi:hypothetical protein